MRWPWRSKPSRGTRTNDIGGSDQIAFRADRLRMPNVRLQVSAQRHATNTTGAGR